MISAIITWLAGLVVRVIGATGYFGVFTLMALESCGIPVPSEVIMPFSGFLVFTGRMNFWFVALIGAVGNLAGSLLAYWISRRGGRPLIEKYGKYIFISHHDLDKADRWFVKYGELTVFFGRLLPVIRTYISFPAGLSEMSWKKFSFYTFIGALPWCVLFTWLGVKMGNNWDKIRETLHSFDMTILVLVILAIAWYIWRHIKEKNWFSK